MTIIAFVSWDNYVKQHSKSTILTQPELLSPVDSYTASSSYQKEFPITDYVSEQTESNSFMHNQILSAMNNSTLFFESDNKIQTAIATFFDNDINFEKKINSVQYSEPKLISLFELPVPDQTHNFEYTGYLNDNTQATGNINIGDHQLAVSFLNPDLSLNRNLALLLSDDSNAEMLAYLIIENTQRVYQTSLSPNKGAEEFYNCNLEQLAGSISYHAFLSLYLHDQEVNGFSIDKTVMIRTSVVNVSAKNDPDSFIVNRSF